jgi:hypothetical protein
MSQSMEKRGVVDDKTPQNNCCGGTCHEREDMTKESADRIEDSLQTRLAEAAAEACKQTKDKSPK